MYQKGVVHLLLPLLILLAAIIGVAVYFKVGISTSLPQVNRVIARLTQGGEGNVALKTEYANPFDQETQYVNPFSTYKNPFDALK